VILGVGNLFEDRFHGCYLTLRGIKSKYDVK